MSALKAALLERVVVIEGQQNGGLGGWMVSGGAWGIVFSMISGEKSKSTFFKMR